MNFAFSDEQDQLRDAVRKFLEAKSPESEVRRLMETTEGYDPASAAVRAIFVNRIAQTFLRSLPRHFH